MNNIVYRRFVYEMASNINYLCIIRLFLVRGSRRHVILSEMDSFERVRFRERVNTRFCLYLYLFAITTLAPHRILAKFNRKTAKNAK